MREYERERKDELEKAQANIYGTRGYQLRQRDVSVTKRKRNDERMSEIKY